MFDIIRLTQLLEEIHQHIKVLHGNDKDIVESVKNRLQMDGEQINKAFAILTNDMRNAYSACQTLSRRIDTLEILASKMFAEEIERPIETDRFKNVN